MTTTAIFAELLVIGFQTALWITLFALAGLGIDPLKDLLPTLEKWAALLSIVAVALAYTLGVIVDRLTDMAYTKWFMKREWFKKLLVLRKQESKFSWQRLFIYVQSGQPSQFMEYSRSRIRIARSSIANIMLMALSVVTFMQLNSLPSSDAVRNFFSLIILAASALSIPAGIQVLASLQQRHDEIVEDLAWLLLNRLQATPSVNDDALQQVAEKLGFQAVPGRKEGG